MSKQGLYANINRRKKLGISRPKSKSTISKEAYSNMKSGFVKKASGGLIEDDVLDKLRETDPDKEIRSSGKLPPLKKQRHTFLGRGQGKSLKVKTTKLF